MSVLIKFINKKCFIDGVDVSMLTRSQQLALLSSIYCLFEATERELGTTVSVFCQFAMGSFDVMKKEPFFLLTEEAKQSVEQDAMTLGKFVNFKLEAFSDGNGLRLMTASGDIIDDKSATNAQVLDALIEGARMYGVFQKCMLKVTRFADRVKKADVKMLENAFDGLSLCPDEVSVEC